MLRRGIVRWSAGWGLGLAVACCLLFGATGVSRADPERARSLIRDGRKALDKGDADAALAKFEEALHEDEGSAEAHYWLAVTHEKRKDPTRAAREYQAFLDLLRAQGRERTLTEEETSLRKKAEGRLDVLAAVDRAVERTRAPFAARMLALAKEWTAANPGLAHRALDTLLLDVPDQDEAREMLKSLGAAAPATKALNNEPPVPISEWWDLLATRALGQNAGWTYGDGDVAIDVGRGQLTYWGEDEPKPKPSAFWYEADFEIEEGPGPGFDPVVGLWFGSNGRECLALLMWPKNLDLVASTIGGAERRALSKLQPGEWAPHVRRKLGVLVRDRRIVVYLDGAALLDTDVTSGPPLTGEVGVLAANAKIRIRTLRLGTVAESPR